MAIRNSLTFSLVLVLSAGGGKLCQSTLLQAPGQTRISTPPPPTLHWLRSLPDPETDCNDTNKGHLVADQHDCKNFYMCDGTAGGFIGPLTCEDGMKCFDAITNSSNPICTDNNIICDGICTAIGPVCKNACSGTIGEQVADAKDCSKHYICVGDDGNELFEAYCPADRPYFNGKECVDAKDQCCTCLAPTCSEIGQLPDPQDCHSYYACVDIGGDLTPFHGTCVDGGSFDVDKCFPDIKDCANICDLGNDVTSTSATTITSIGSSAMATATSITSTMATTIIRAPTTTDGCTDLSDFTCHGNDFYARCPYCDPSFFSCIDNKPKIGYCPEPFMFNTDPAAPYCMRPENCPFHPPQIFNP